MLHKLSTTNELKVLVVGDVMLDRYWWGSVERISPEAPVPVVRLERKSAVAGGAANVAANIKGLGAEPLLVGAVGTDPEASELRTALGEKGIRTDHLIGTGRPTTIKTRIIAHSQQVVRIDQEEPGDLSAEQAADIRRRCEELLDECGVVLVSDYAKGVVTADLVSRLITKAKEKGRPVIVDPKGIEYAKYRGATVLTPNEKEALEAAGLEQRDPKTFERAGRKLLDELDLEGLIITRGGKGMALFRPDRPVSELEASARKVYDVTGAGDTVIASFSVGIGVGMDFGEAASFANLAAGLVVEEVGTTSIDLDKLAAAGGAFNA